MAMYGYEFMNLCFWPRKISRLSRWCVADLWTKRTCNEGCAGNKRFCLKFQGPNMSQQVAYAAYTAEGVAAIVQQHVTLAYFGNGAFVSTTPWKWCHCFSKSWRCRNTVMLAVLSSFSLCVCLWNITTYQPFISSELKLLSVWNSVKLHVILEGQLGFQAFYVPESVRFIK